MLQFKLKFPSNLQNLTLMKWHWIELGDGTNKLAPNTSKQIMINLHDPEFPPLKIAIMLKAPNHLRYSTSPK
jgi:hypothetical protein